MSTCQFGWPIYSDPSNTYTPTFSGGHWAATLPLTNLADRRLAKVARSSSTATSDTVFITDLKVDRPVRLVALPKHSMSSAGQWRVVGYPASMLFDYEVGDDLTAKGGTFARTGSATYVDANGIVQTAGTGVVRDGHYISGVRHLLLEKAATNLITYSRALQTSPWTNNSTSGVTQNQTGVDGTANAAWTVPITISGNQWLYYACSGTAGAQYTFSIYLKGSGTTKLVFYDNVSGFQTTTVTLTSTLTRYTITKTFGVGATDMRVGFGDPSTGGATTCTSVIADAAQLEAGGSPTSYIATSGSTATRNADSLYFTYTPVPQAMTVYVKGTEAGNTTGSSGPRLIEISDGSSAPRFLVYFDGTNYSALHDNNVSTVSSRPATVPSIGQTFEFRATLASNGAVTGAVSVNGGAESVGSTSASLTLAGAWAGTRLYVTGGNAINALRSVRLSTGSSNSLATMQGLVYDSGWLTPWPGSLTAEDLAKPDGTTLNVVAFTTVPSTFNDARYWTVQLSDTGNTAGYLDVARLVIAGAFTPSVNINDGDKMSYESDTVRSVTPGGAALYDVRASRRVEQFAINSLTSAESLASVRKMQRQLGLSGQFLWIPDPSDTTYGYERNYLAVLRELGALEATALRYNTTFSVVEEL